MLKCPHCQNENNQVKAGKTRSGSQRYECKDCRRRYTPNPKQQGYADDVRQQAVRLSVDGMNYRRIARQIRVSHTSVMNWVTAAADRLPDAPPVPDQVTVIEEDELFTFVERKKTKSTS